MPFSVSPAVQVVEKDLSAIIPSVATTIGAFVGRFDWGPVDEIVDIGSEQELFGIFGPPSPDERGTDWFCAANFLNYGDRLKVVRIDENRPAGNPGTSAYSGATSAYVLSGATSARLEAKNAGNKGNAFQWLSWNNGQLEPKLPNDTTLFTYAPTSTQSVYDSFQAGVLGDGGDDGAGLKKMPGTTLDEVHIALVDTLGYFGASGSVLEMYEGLSRWKGVVDNT